MGCKYLKWQLILLPPFSEVYIVKYRNKIHVGDTLSFYMHYNLSSLKLGTVPILKCFYFSIHYDIYTSVHMCLYSMQTCLACSWPAFIMIAQSHLHGIKP